MNSFGVFYQGRVSHPFRLLNLAKKDEPTSGLDSVSAKQVMALLKRVAQANTTVIFSKFCRKLCSLSIVC